MELLTTIYRHENVNIEGRTFFREAARGIIFRDGKLLMIYSTINGDYKFPGGGIKAGEPHEEALRREIREESGAMLTQVTGELGKILEYANAIEPDFVTFKMRSYYYFCQINRERGNLQLDDYEAKLGFQPVWVSLEAAIKTNKQVIAEAKLAPMWTRREIFVLELLQKQAKVNFSPTHSKKHRA